MPLLIRATFVLLGLGLFFGTLWSVRKTLQARTWPSAEGRITHSALYVDPDPVDGGTRADIAYVFSVAGTQYESKQITLAPTWQSEAYKARLLDRFRSGSAVAVRYDPKHCSQSVLCTEIHPGWPLATVVGLAFAAAGVFAP